MIIPANLGRTVFDGSSFMLNIPSSAFYYDCAWPYALFLFPGLKLSQLTVFDAKFEFFDEIHGHVQRTDTISLAREGMGWKQLNFVTPEVERLLEIDKTTCRPVEQNWDAEIKERDQDKNAYARFYAAKKEFQTIKAAVLDPEKREEVHWKLGNRHQLPRGEIMVTMSRGVPASYATPRYARFPAIQECRRLARDYSWARMFEEGWVAEADVWRIPDSNWTGTTRRGRYTESHYCKLVYDQA
jgi:hypothetical protein